MSSLRPPRSRKRRARLQPRRILTWRTEVPATDRDPSLISCAKDTSTVRTRPAKGAGTVTSSDQPPSALCWPSPNLPPPFLSRCHPSFSHSFMGGDIYWKQTSWQLVVLLCCLFFLIRGFRGSANIPTNIASS